ncbi:MAG: ATP-binding protein [Sandaracinaceae bacterium]|nr:ATP-binding protein [Sandaracinaceae bacterium]
MTREELAARLRAIFREELADHIRTWDEVLLRVEREGEASASPADVQQLFRVAHSLKGAARTVGLDVLERYCHDLEERLDDVRSGRAALGPLAPDLLAASRVWAEAQRRLAEGLPIDESALTPRADEEWPAEGSSGATLRVAPERLDGVLVHVSDLLRLGARVEGSAARLARARSALARARSERAARRALAEASDALEALEHDLARDGHELSRLGRELDESIRAARLVPFGEACEGLARVARDLARAHDREVELTVEGSGAELDRAIVEGLRSPLVQLVRNAIVHGLEPRAAREEAGKPPAGRVTVAASLRGAEIHVSVADDGRGLDLDAIAARARSLGIDPPEDDASRAQLIFTPGLSTAASVDTASGRGVGLDVVKAHVESLHGRVELETTPGAGTRFVVALPLTLTLLRALLMRAGDVVAALPSTHVLALRRVDVSEAPRVDGRPTLVHDGEPVPIERLAVVLGLSAEAPVPRSGALVPVVVVQAARERVALAVDELLSVEDVVVEPLDRGSPACRTSRAPPSCPMATSPSSCTAARWFGRRARCEARSPSALRREGPGRCSWWTTRSPRGCSRRPSSRRRATASSPWGTARRRWPRSSASRSISSSPTWRCRA